MVVTSGAVWLGHGAELLVAADDCLAGVGMNVGTMTAPLLHLPWGCVGSSLVALLILA